MTHNLDRKTVAIALATAALGSLGLIYWNLAFLPSYLRKQIERSLKLASTHGSAVPLDTTKFEIRRVGIVFEVRLASALAKKPELAHNAGEKKSPFVPPFEPGMLVTQLESGHRVILNKFPVLDFHVIVASESEVTSQNGPLTSADFLAVGEVLRAVGRKGVAFYNHGKDSGFSQSHLHMQVVELEKFPLLWHYKQSILRDQLPFKVAVIPMKTPQLLGVDLNDAMRDLGLTWAEESSFNLLWTSEFLVVIPRTKASTSNGLVALNGLSYSGSLFVKSQAALDFLGTVNPLDVLKQLGVQRF